MAWQKNGTPDTLASASDKLTISDLTAKIFNQFLIHKISSGNADLLCTLANTGGNDYASRYSVNGGADGTEVSQADMFTMTGAQANDDFVVHHLINITNEEKLSIIFSVGRGTTGAGNAPDRIELVTKFDTSTITAQITEIEYDNGGTGSYDTGSNLSALGTSDTVDTIE